ncbi:MAG TPA: hypothetical protein VN622_10885 [Clostridia bacterium]|nr:hypothetical protein [Clostridia bacterium]
MAIQYSGGTIVNTTFVSDGTRRQLVDQLAAALATAGWSYVSGSGTADVLMKTAVTPQGLSVRFRLYDSGAGNCAQFTMKNNAGTLTSAIAYMLPTAGRTFRIWANQYWFAMFASGAVYRSSPRNIMLGGTISGVPANILASLGADLDVGWFNWSGDTDTSVAFNFTFRDRLSSWGGTSNSTYSASIWKSFLLNYSNYANSFPQFPMLVWYANGTFCPNWDDGTVVQIDARIGWSATASINGTFRYKGFLSDAFVLGSMMNGESDLITFDGHTWMPITDQSASLATLYVMVS